MTGLKDDGDKVRMDLVPLSVIWEVAKVLTFGASKYKANSWQNLENGYERYKGALLRHLAQSEYEDTDGESGMLHTSHMTTCAVFMLFYKMRDIKNGKTKTTNADSTTTTHA